MKLLYIANIRLPTEKAHGIQIMEMCSAFAEKGLEVELVIPKRYNTILDDPFEYYDIRHVFSIRTVPCLDFVRFGRIGFLIESVSFTAVAVWYSLFKKDAVFYTRDELVALCLRVLGKQVAWEGHTGQKNWVARMLIRLQVPIVVITEALRELYVSRGAISSKIIIAPDGADISRFNIEVARKDARKELGLPLDEKIALYAGHLYPRKGADTLAAAATHLPKIRFIFVGGTEDDVATFKNKWGSATNIKIIGHVSHGKIPFYLRGADLLVLPNSGKDENAARFTSPMKLFEYMASGTPIVASDVPALREVLDDTTALFVPPDDPQSLAKVIASLFAHYPEACARALKTISIAKEYSWDTRAQNILSFLRGI